MSHPTEEGWYWLRHDYINHFTKEVMPGAIEVARVIKQAIPRTKNPVKLRMVAIYSGCTVPLADMKEDLCHWRKIEQPKDL
jgi:hypothetical protein